MSSIGLSKGDTRSLDYSSYDLGPPVPIPCPWAKAA